MHKNLMFLTTCLFAIGSATSAVASTAYSFTTLAGKAGTVVKSIDATGSAAQFNEPRGVVFDSVGNLFVADSTNNTIRKITSAGVVTTFAGTAGVQGRKDGSGTLASFIDPYALAIDKNDNLFIADTSNGLIRKITPAGLVSTFAGETGTIKFSEPRGVAVDSGGNVFLTDMNNNVVRKVTAAGVVSTFAGTERVIGSSDGTGSAASFKAPMGLAIDRNDNLYVADTANRSVRKITPAGVVTTLAGVSAGLREPRGLTVDVNGNVYVTDYAFHTISKITPAGVVSAVAGSNAKPGSADATGSAALFYAPSGIAFDNRGNLYLADTSNNTIRTLTTEGVTSTFAGTAGRSSSVDGTGDAAVFEDPYGVTADLAGNVYVSDAGDHTVRKITPAGVVTTLAGKAGSFGSSDGSGGSGGTARFFAPLGITADSGGNLYLSDTGNHTVRKISAAGTVTTLAGKAGEGGGTDGVGTAARLSNPYGIGMDNNGILYVIATAGNTLRKIATDGTVSTLAGKEGSNGMVNGSGSAASFLVPFGLAVDTRGENIYVCDHGNHAIRKVTSSGVVTTLAGTGSAGSADGTGTAASMRFPSAVAVDANGTVFVADTDNQSIRMITSAGVVTTIGGGNTPGSSDGVGTAAKFFNPKSIAVDAAGNLYIADRSNHTIRKGTLVTVVPDGAPVCTLAASPSSLATGAKSTLTATCSPAATSYAWTNAGFANSASGGSVTPYFTTTYSVIGSNAIGDGAAASVAVTVTDSSAFAGKRSDYTITRTSSGFTVTDNVGGGGTQTFTGATSRLKFSDTYVAMDIDGIGGEVYRLYQAAFDRKPDLGGFGYQIAAREVSGLSLLQLAQNFINSPEFSSKYGSLSNTDFATQMYTNILHRAPEPAGLQFYVDGLDGNVFSRAQVLQGFSAADENKALVKGDIENGMEYTPLP